MAEGPFGKSHSSIPPAPPSRTSTSANSSQRPPTAVIEISSSEGEDVRFLAPSRSRPKSISHEKRSSSSKQPSLDVSSWNARPSNTIKDLANHRSVFSSSTSRPSLPASRQNVSSQSQSTVRSSTNARPLPPNAKRHSFTTGQSNLMSSNPPNIQLSKQNARVESTSLQPTTAKTVIHTSQPITSAFPQFIHQSGHVTSKQNYRHSLQGSTLPEKESSTTCKSSRPSLPTNGEALRSVRPLENIVDKRNLEQGVSSSSSRKPPQLQKDVITQLNSFNQRGSDRSTTSKDQSKSSNPSISTNLPNPVNQRSGENLSHSSSSVSSGLLRNAMSHTVPPKHISSASSSTNPTIQVNHLSGRALSSITNPTSEQRRSRELRVLVPSSGVSNVQNNAIKPSAVTVDLSTKVGKWSVATVQNHKPNSSSNIKNKDVVHVHKKRKCETGIESNTISHKDRFTELADPDHQEPIISTSQTALRQQPTASTSTYLPSKQAPVASKTGSQSKAPASSMATSTAPCVVHAYTTLPLPKSKPRARPQSPDWSGVPRHERPLQGQERQEEFTTELQKYWILKNDPDLSTERGHRLFTEEINSNQILENPEIPRIDVIVPDEVREKLLEDPSADDSLAPPLEFVYTDRLIYRTDERPIPPKWHCNCRGDCNNNPKCECRAHQHSKTQMIIATMGPECAETFKHVEGFAYYSTRKPKHSHHKKLENEDPEARCLKEVFITGQLPVFECNSLCGCGPDCINRTVGRGRREKLSLEKTVSRGWGVFANHPIPIGRFVTHYSGEILTDKMAHERGEKYDKIGRTYVFNLDPWWINEVYSQNFVNDGLFVMCEDNKKPSQANTTTTTRTDSKDLNSSTVSKGKAAKSVPEPEEESQLECIYSVDAFLYGNVARFINHSCNPNTHVVPVYIEDSDPTRPIFAMFAVKTIKTGKEITTPYSNPYPDDDEWKEKKKELMNSTEPRLGRYMECKCGAPNCRGIMFA